MTSKFLIAPCAYKGYFSPIQLCDAIESGIKEAINEVEIKALPLADGGDGTIDSLHHLLGGELIKVEVEGPTGKPVQAFWLMLKSNESNSQHSIVELASASGIAYLKDEELAPLTAHTKGVGQVIKDCLNKNISEITLTVGGSASTDGAMGALQELGLRFYDKEGNLLPPGGGSLSKIDKIDCHHMDKNLNHCNLKIVTDVNNPLYGETGAAHIYGPQKGATDDDVISLDKGLRNYALVVEKLTGKPLAKEPGMGAAGGVPFGICSFLNAKILNGFSWFSELIELDRHVKNADIVISAEGYLDSQSLQGKAIGQLARLCKTYQKRLWVTPAKFEKNIDWGNYGIAEVKETSTDKIATLDDIQRAVKSLCEKNIVI